VPMLSRRLLVTTLVSAAPLGLAACAGGPQAAAVSTPTTAPSPSPQAFQVRVQMIPQEARLGTDEQVIVRATFLRLTGGQLRPVSGAQISAVANYPSGPQRFSSEVTTFPDGRAPDVAIPVAPAQRPGNVRVEVILQYQGHEFMQPSGFTVR
jgi:hypothetical protein